MAVWNALPRSDLERYLSESAERFGASRIEIEPMPEDKKTETPARKRRQPRSDDDVVGKAYDGRLMRRLLTYLRPYKLQTGLSAAAIILKAGSDVIGPYLVKVAVDTYMTPSAADRRGTCPGWPAI